VSATSTNPITAGTDARSGQPQTPSGTAPTKLRIDHVAKAFPIAGQGGRAKTVLRDVSLDVAEGEFISLIGPSGCGKSTLLEIVAGLQSATRGRVLVDGKEITGPGPDRAVVFQHYALFPWRTVIDNVAFPLEVAGVRKRERRERAEERLQAVGLATFGKYYPSQLSGGMRQRVALARAYVRDPQVLLMDEPFGALDAITRDLLQEQLSALHQVDRKTVIFVTHSVSEAIRLSNRIVVMGIAPADIVEVFDLGEQAAAGGEFAAREAAFVHVRDAIWSLLREHGGLERHR
jgi:NitT/TauT family transport system ATP-binding protein